MHSFEVEIIHTSRKKTISFQVVEKKLRVLAPKDYPNKEIESLIEKKRTWIEKKFNDQNNFQSRRISHLKKIDSAKIFILAKAYEIKIISNHTVEQVVICGDTLEIQQKSLEKSHPKKAISQIFYFLMEYSYQILTERYHLYSETMNLKAQSIQVKNYQSKWGSCTRDGRISFNCKIIQAPIDVIDYLVVHELSHIRHHHHQKSFWQLVEKNHPNFKQARKWLKIHQKELLSLG